MNDRVQAEEAPGQTRLGQPPGSKGKDLLSTSLGVLGGWVGAILLLGTLGASVGLFFARGHLDQLGRFGYLGVALIAFLGNAPVIPVFPWHALVAPLSGIYSTAGLVLAGVAGATLGETVPYMVGLKLYKAHKGHPWIVRLVSLPRHLRFLALFLLSLSPVFSFPGLAAAFLRVPLWAMIGMKALTEGLKLYILLEVVILARRLLFSG